LARGPCRRPGAPGAGGLGSRGRRRLRGDRLPAPRRRHRRRRAWRRWWRRSVFRSGPRPAGPLGRHYPEPFYLDNAQATHVAAAAYNDRVRPALERLQALAGEGDPERLLRARSECASLLGLVGTGWEWAGEFEKAELTLIAALELAEGSQAEAGIRRDLERCRARADQLRAVRGGYQCVVAEKSFVYSETQTGAGGGTAAPWTLAAPSGRGARKNSSGAGMSGVAATMLAIVIVKGLLLLNNEPAPTTPSNFGWTPRPSLESLRRDRLSNGRDGIGTSSGSRVRATPSREDWPYAASSELSLTPPALRGPKSSPRPTGATDPAPRAFDPVGETNREP
jgi:hypothetical protein